MPWSVIAPDAHPIGASGHRRVYDVFVPRGPVGWSRQAGSYQHVYLIRVDPVAGEQEKIHLGAVMRVARPVAATENWWAMAYYPNVLDPEALSREQILGEGGIDQVRPESARGFATRRYAIEHMLRRTGWWPDV